MEKKLIRLTESDLHRIVKESVDKILTELDWKTYMNAARARQAQGNTDAANKLSNYSNQQFKQKHFGNDGEYWEDGEHQRNGIGANVDINSGYMTDTRYGDWNNQAQGKDIHNFGTANFNRGTNKMEYGKGYSKQHNMSGNGNLGNTSNSFNQKMQSVGNDLNGYYNGQSQYIKGKGWQ